MNETIILQSSLQTDAWIFLKEYTSARIALGRTGTAIPVKETLDFKLAHAHAKDAVFSTLEKEALARSMEQIGSICYWVESKAKSRKEYLQRPDLGRILHKTSAQLLQNLSKEIFDIAIVVADGLSATAINKHALPLLNLLLPSLQSAGITTSPIIFVEQGRVAIADEIGFILKAKLSLILIGERPGLTSPCSMGAYLTYGPAPRLTDEARNCISNIHEKGLNYSEASQKIIYLIKTVFSRQLSGIRLKEYRNESLNYNQVE